MERRSPRLRRVLTILASQPALQRAREMDNIERRDAELHESGSCPTCNAEARRWADCKRTHNLPADADPYAGDWF